jgi:hypothetical protein
MKPSRLIYLLLLSGIAGFLLLTTPGFHFKDSGRASATPSSHGLAGTYKLTVTAKSGATNQSIPLTLIVE